MNLENENKEYLDLKSKISKAEKYISTSEATLESFREDLIIHNAEMIKAKRAGDNALEASEKAEIDKIKEQIESLKKDILETKISLEEFKINLDEKIEAIKQDPAMKQVMNEALEKRYDRQVKKYNKEKEKALLEKDAKTSEKNRFEALKQLITEHPALEKNLNGIITAKQTIKKLNDELATLDYKKDAKRIAVITGKEMKEATDKLDKNKQPLMNYINKNNINVKFEDIEKLAETGLSLDDTIDGLGKDIKAYDKKIKGYDKSIHNYSVSLANIRGEMEGQVQTQSGRNSLVPANKPKWYQFGKRFKNWMQQRKQAQLPNPTAPSTRTDTIRDALKYDIVRDIVGYNDKNTGEHVFGTMEQQQLHDAKKQQSGNER